MVKKAELKNLRKRIREARIPTRRADRLHLLTWNIHNLNGRKEDKAVRYIAEVCKKFDIIAIQEVKRDLGGIEKLQRELGSRYRFLLTDPAGNNERLAFCYDSKRVQFTGLAAEVVMSPGSGRPKVNSMLEFDRTPYMASFRKNGCNFIIVTVHIYYGTKMRVKYRLEEIKNLAKYLEGRSTAKDTLDSDYIACGDFNIDKTSLELTKKRKRSEKQQIIDSLFEALKSGGLTIPEDIRNSPSNLTKTKHYDQIGFHRYRDSTLKYQEGGTIDFVDAVYVNDPKVRYRLTDHLPMWAVFSVSPDPQPKCINPDPRKGLRYCSKKAKSRI